MKSIAPDVWKVPADSNVYILCGASPMVIDTGRRSNQSLVLRDVARVVSPDKVSAVVCTHLHYDHAGNVDLFPNADVFASSEEIACLQRDPQGTVLERSVAELLRTVPLKPLPHSIHGLEVMSTPGHTAGSVCLWYQKEQILFSGDTLLLSGHGRTDLPSSRPALMQHSLDLLRKYPYRMLCPGHEY